MNRTKEKVVHVGKGLISFVIIYFLSAVIMEGILILAAVSQGYHVMQGDMPKGFLMNLIPLYGFVGFTLVTIAFNKWICKRKISDMGIAFANKKILYLLFGIAIGSALVGVIIVLLTLSGAYQLNGIGSIDVRIALISFGAYLVQSFTEELMCRGFLQNYLEEKVTRFTAIGVSTAAFIAPHFMSIVEYGPCIAVVSFVNLFLVSVLFSFTMVCSENIWLPAGIHAGWNYMLSYICGMQLSGSDSAAGILNFEVNQSMSWLHGGEYGIEAGLVVSVILVVCDVILFAQIKEKKYAGVQ